MMMRMLSERLLGKSLRVYVCAQQVTTNNEITREKSKKQMLKLNGNCFFEDEDKTEAGKMTPKLGSRSVIVVERLQLNYWEFFIAKFDCLHAIVQYIQYKIIYTIYNLSNSVYNAL